MYGKLVVANGAAYLLVVGADLPELTWVQIGVAVLSAPMVLADLQNDGPSQRLGYFLQRLQERLRAAITDAERRHVLRETARKELEANFGIVMPEDLEDDDRKWLRDQARLASKEAVGVVR
jgi:hypothetical protein